MRSTDAPTRLADLPSHAFSRLRGLLDAHEPGGDPLDLSLGAPRSHPVPPFVSNVLSENLEGFARYPPNEGTPELLAAIGGWMRRRHGIEMPAERLMVLNGTREGLYNVAMALLPRTDDALVLVPNPFYQVYMVAALSVAAQPIFVAASAETGFLPDYRSLGPDRLNRTTAAFICSPSNPQGALADRAYLRDLLELAERYDFRVFSDECYSEIYRETPPPGLLEVAAEMGANPERAFAFNSLSKRSNLPGLRSGFVAGGRRGIAQIRQLRAYAGAPSPLPLQHVAARAWDDEDHVIASRAIHRAKYAIADEVFDGMAFYHPPEAGFFLWLAVEDSERAASALWKRHGIRVLPGAYLTRGGGGCPNEAHYIRVAMVIPPNALRPALERVRDTLVRSP